MRSPPPPGATRFDVVGLGEISFDEMVLVEGAPRWGGKQRARRIERLGGGQVATALAALQRLGRRTALVGVVGDDGAGDRAVAELSTEGVDVSGVIAAAGGATHASVIVVDERGERTVLWSEPPELAAALAASEQIEQRAAEGAILHVDGSYLDVAVRAARAAHAAGRLVSCDLERYEPPLARELLALTDICIVSPALLADLAGVPEEEPEAGLPALAALLPDRGVACVTLGARGAAALVEGVALAQPAFKVRPVVDTTSCGDTFRAGFLAALLDGAPAAECLRRGCAAAALTARDLGRRGCPTRAELSAFLACTGVSHTVPC